MILSSCQIWEGSCIGDVAEFAFLLAPRWAHIFDAISCSGKFESTKLMGMIMQIYKSKGVTGYCTHYCGMTIRSVLSKTHVSLLNTHLVSF